MDNLGSEIDNELDTGSEANPVDGSQEVSTVQDATNEGVPAAGEGANGSGDPLAVDGNQVDNNLGGKQPSTTDPFAQFKQWLGDLQSNGKPIEIRDGEHAKRLLLSGYGAAQEVQRTHQERAQYETLRKANEWFNNQIDPNGPTGAFVKQMKEDPKLFQDVAAIYANPQTQKVMNYMRVNPDVANTFAQWVGEWEQKGQLNPTTLENHQLKTQKEVYESRFKEIEQMQEQERQRQAEQQEIAQVNGLVNEYNNGIPFTQAQYGAIKIMRDGMRLQSGYENTTFAQALAELKSQGMWTPARKNPGPGAPGGQPPAQRQKPGYAEEDAEQVRAKLMANW
jgi:hypothetical protein